MPIKAELLADDPAGAPGSTVSAAYGTRAALILGVSMVLALALVTSLRWTEDSSSTLEKIVQQPIPADATANAPRIDLTAPDPGDSPP